MPHTSTLIGFLIVLTIIAGLIFSLFSISRGERVLLISSFAECKAAGYPIMESYPEQCRTPDGRSFVNPEQQAPYGTTTPSGGIVANGCAVGGCSSQLCGEAGDELMSTCEYRAEYACYKEASCERQSDGRCGWTQTTELAQCLAHPPALDVSVEATY